MARESIEVLEGPAAVIPYNVHVVVADVALLPVAARVEFCVRGHHGWYVKNHFGRAVPPAEGILAVRIRLPVQPVRIERRTAKCTKCAKFGEEIGKIRRAAVIRKNLYFLVLAGSDVDDANFVAVDGRIAVEIVDDTNHAVILGNRYCDWYWNR